MDEAVGLAHRVGTCGASRHHGDVGTLGIIGDGDIATGDIRNHLGDEERRDAAQTVLQLVGMLTLKGLDATDAAAYSRAEATRVNVLSHPQATVLHGLCGSCQGKKGKAVIVTYHRLVDAKGFGAELLDFGGNLHGQVLAVDLLDVIDAADTVYHAVPQRFNIVSKWSNASYSGDKHSIHNRYNVFYIINNVLLRRW